MDQPWPITDGDIPAWYVVDRLSLPQYLAKNSTRSVVRIFAREVLITDDAVWQASVSKDLLDLRIDCETLTIVGRVKIDLSGSDTALGFQAADPMKWNPFPPGNYPPQSGFNAPNSHPGDSGWPSPNACVLSAVS